MHYWYIYGAEISKSKINITLDKDLIDDAKIYAKEQRTSVCKNSKRSKKGIRMGSFLKNLKKIFTEPAGGSKSNFITFKVKCSKCGEEIEVKARSTSDISRIYEGEGPSGAAFF